MGTVTAGLDVRIAGDASSLNHALDSSTQEFIKYRAGLQAAKGALQDFQKQQSSGHGLGGILGEIGKVGLGMAGGGALLGGVEGIKSFSEGVINAVGAVEDLGVATGVSWKRIQELQFGAVQAGASIDDLGKAIFTLQNKLADTKPSEKTAESLANLGLSFAELKNSTPDEQLNAVMRALGQLEPGADRTSAAMELLGKSGKRLLPLSEEMDNLTAKAHEFGAVMSDETIRSVKHFDDAMKSAQMSIKAFLAEMAVNIVNLPTNVLSAVDNERALRDTIDPVGQAALNQQMRARRQAKKAFDAAAEREDAIKETQAEEDDARNMRHAEVQQAGNIAAQDREVDALAKKADAVLKEGEYQLKALEVTEKITEENQKLNDLEIKRLQTMQAIKKQQDDIARDVAAQVADAALKRATVALDHVMAQANALGAGPGGMGGVILNETAAEAKKARRELREDDQLREKIERQNEGQRVTFTAKQKKRILEMREAEGQAAWKAGVAAQNAGLAQGAIEAAKEKQMALDNAGHLTDIAIATMKSKDALEKLATNLRVVDQ